MRATVDKRRAEHGGERYATIQERLPLSMRKAGWYVLVRGRVRVRGGTRFPR